MNNFDLALKFTLKHEGGFSDDPVDPGGRTNHGITQRVYSEYLKEHGFEDNDVKNIGDAEVRDIYEDDYWFKGNCDRMDKLLSIVHFDSCVNVGIHQAAKFLQRSIGIDADGIIGPVTLHSLSRSVQDSLVFLYVDYRRKFYDDLCAKNEALKRFQKGWYNRLDDLLKYLTEVV